jgi:hypothetical protein
MEIVLGNLNALISLGILALLVAIAFTKSVNLLLVAATLFLKLLELEGGAIDIFSEGERVVALGLSLTLEPENLSFSTGDLLTESSDLNLHIVIAATLIVEMVSAIVALLLEAVERNAVRVLASLKLVFLEQFFVLQVAVLGLDGVKLISQCQVVLVSLLDLEDFSLQLTNEEVFLVGSQVNAIVVS